MKQFTRFGLREVGNPWQGKPVAVKRAAGKPEMVRGETIGIALVKGEIATLFPKGVKPAVKRIVTDGSRP